MQRLEVSGAVRPIYGSLGVKLLMLIWNTVKKIGGERAKENSECALTIKTCCTNALIISDLGHK